MDQLNDVYTTRTKSLRWVNVGLAYVLDTCRVNAKTLYCISNQIEINKRDLSYKFGWELSMQLIKPFAQARTMNGLSKMVQLKRRILLGEPLEQPARITEERGISKRSRCDIHIQEAKTKKEKDLAPKSKKQCKKCNRVVCPQHYEQICTLCFDE